MTDNPAPSATPPDEDLSAAEYALGVLTASEREAVERRMAASAGFAGEVAAWEERLIPLVDEIPSQTPPPVVWRRIAAQLALIGAGRVVRPSAWNNVALWRGAAGVAAMAAAACLAIVVWVPRTVVQPAAPIVVAAAPEPIAVALLRPETGPASFVVTLDQDRQQLIITPVVVEGRAGRSLQLWLMPTGEKPISLGLLDPERPLVLRADQLVGPNGPRATLGVSLEPLGGAPNGQPTGPVVATGHLSPV